jgi:hypothetical protein
MGADEMTRGDQITVRLATGRVIPAQVQFAGEHIITIAEGGGCFAILRFDDGLNSWTLGGVRAAIEEVAKR